MMPVDVAVRFCLSSSPPLCLFLSNHDNRCSPSAAMLRPCLCCERVAKVTTSSSSAAESGQVRRKKKSVVFADSQGLALTAVHVFHEDEDEDELQFHLTEIEGAADDIHLGEGTDSTDGGSVLVLDFTPPAEDYLDLRNRLKAQQVCLETCSVQDRLLSGSVQDVGCRYLNNVYGGSNTDTFSFSVSVPDLLEPCSRVEFCIRYQTREQTFWDNNLGNNYRLVLSGPSRSAESPAGKQNQRAGTREQMEFDPFGSPRTSVGIFPEWQSWGQIDGSAPYW
ncbi:protein phosphatase 1 regulatory subunit 3C-B-like isoform X2 [Acanthochromis polyacanthus]|uniref:protein phosphatase 1 regulatory subunit 3C-B-like isoform X2 n=1 Tax=Acanthochromis polyacanthus TaxID=80966 RepID=UPI000B8FEB6B|nr:protein phosphatase 1 regulatory subunit 3C-B-like isoform X2 [Acanthochromis polyacanthus]